MLADFRAVGKIKTSIIWLKLWKIKYEKILGFSLIIFVGISLSWDTVDVSKFLTPL